jgi:hypothetical protein
VREKAPTPVPVGAFSFATPAADSKTHSPIRGPRLALVAGAMIVRRHGIPTCCADQWAAVRQPARCRKPARMGDKAKPSALLHRRLCCLNFRTKRISVSPVTGAQDRPGIALIWWSPCSPEDASARRQSRRGLSLHSPLGGSAVCLHRKFSDCC